MRGCIRSSMGLPQWIWFERTHIGQTFSLLQHHTYVEKIYGMIRGNLKKEISPLLGLCIQAPRTSKVSLVRGSSRSVANTETQKALIVHWQGTVQNLGNFLNTLKENPIFGS
ncbi:hypothetical protein VNO77_34206 [Canavalia gladiata]|uniref:Uncharacterized protein n=1 Tax=Canavalia gladiata TaxID=3824 RepID=A0AAN9KD82_CANGL